MSTKRTPNVYDLVDQDLRRYHDHNPLYDLLPEEFDKAFLEHKLNLDYILNNYYVDKRDDESVTNESIFSHFMKLPKKISSSKDLARYTNDPENFGLVYLLIGKKGIGKTTLLRHFIIKYINTLENRKSILPIYFDLKTRKRDKKFLLGLPDSLLQEIYKQVRDNERQIYKYFVQPEYMKKLDQAYENLDNSDLAKYFLEHRDVVVYDLLRYLNSNNFELIFVIDNIDDFGENYVNIIIDWCERIKTDYGVKCVIAVRDYWTPKMLKIEDSKLCSMHLSRPNAREILKARLNKIDTGQSSGKNIILEYDKKEVVLTSEDIISSFNKIIEDLTTSKQTQYILHDIFKLTNYNMRDFLYNMYYFFHSPYLYSRPNFIKAVSENIREIDKSVNIGHMRPLRFFDFLECFMTPHALCYDIVDSRICNIFFHKWKYSEGHNYRNTLIFIRILQIAPEMNYQTIKKDYIINQLNNVGYYDDEAIKDAITKLLHYALLESPNGVCYEDVNEVRLSPKGQLYLDKLALEYSYILYIADEVPMEKSYKVDINKKFGDEPIPLERGDLNLKHESVRNFIRFLRQEEVYEQEACPKDKIDLLDIIKNGEDIHKKISLNIEVTIDKMLKAPPRNVKKITGIRKTLDKK